MDLATVDHLLTTTRSVRKRLDLSRAVEPEVIERCIELAGQAPTGGNRQGWHFVVVTAPELRAQVAEHYRLSCDVYSEEQRGKLPADLDSKRVAQLRRVRDSSRYLADHMHEAPVLILP